MPFWVTNGEPFFYRYINLGSSLSYLYRYFIKIMAMLLFYKLEKKYLNTEIPLLQKIGMTTLGIYAIQFSVIHLLTGYMDILYVAVKIVVVGIFAVPICYLIVIYIRKVKYIRLLLLTSAAINCKCRCSKRLG